MDVRLSIRRRMDEHNECRGHEKPMGSPGMLHGPTLAVQQRVSEKPPPAGGCSGEERLRAVVEVPADRFAREIVGFLKPSCAARSRRLNPGRWAAHALWRSPSFCIGGRPV